MKWIIETRFIMAFNKNTTWVIWVEQIYANKKIS